MSAGCCYMAALELGGGIAPPQYSVVL